MSVRLHGFLSSPSFAWRKPGGRGQLGFTHPYIVNMMRQRRQGQLRLPLSQLRYLALSR